MFATNIVIGIVWLAGGIISLIASQQSPCHEQAQQHAHSNFLSEACYLGVPVSEWTKSSLPVCEPAPFLRVCIDTADCSNPDNVKWLEQSYPLSVTVEAWLLVAGITLIVGGLAILLYAFLTPDGRIKWNSVAGLAVLLLFAFTLIWAGIGLLILLVSHKETCPGFTTFSLVLSVVAVIATLLVTAWISWVDEGAPFTTYARLGGKQYASRTAQLHNKR